MANDLEEIKSIYPKLSFEDRRELINWVLADLHGPPDDPAEVEAATDKMLAERLADIKSGKVKPIPSEEVWAEIDNDLL
jgi:ferric iron reductase protein FhuF